MTCFLRADLPPVLVDPGLFLGGVWLMCCCEDRDICTALLGVAAGVCFVWGGAPLLLGLLHVPDQDRFGVPNISTV